MEAGSGRYISISCLSGGDSMFTVRGPLASARGGGGKTGKESDCVLDTWVMTRLERARRVEEERKGKMHKRRRYYIYTLGGGTSMNCTRETHQNTKRQRTGRERRKKWKIVVGDKQIDS